MTATRPISRFKAASIHLLISAAIGTATLGIMLTLWYPPPLFQAMGGTELIMLIVGIDVAIGPLVTLIVFDRQKKELLFDLTVVVTLQLAALVYGIHAMHAGRPVFGVLVEDRFIVVSAADLEPESLAKALRPEFRTLPLNGPRWVVADAPTDRKEVMDILFARLAGLGTQNQPRYFIPYNERRRQVMTIARPLHLLMKISPQESASIDKALVHSGHTREQIGFVPVLTRQMPLTALIDQGSGDLIAIVPVDTSSAWRAARMPEQPFAH